MSLSNSHVEHSWDFRFWDFLSIWTFNPLCLCVCVCVEELDSRHVGFWIFFIWLEMPLWYWLPILLSLFFSSLSFCLLRIQSQKPFHMWHVSLTLDTYRSLFFFWMIDWLRFFWAWAINIVLSDSIKPDVLDYSNSTKHKKYMKTY